MNDLSLFFELIKNELFGFDISPDVIASIDDETIGKIYHIAKRHRCSNLLFNPLVNCGLLCEESSLYGVLQKDFMNSVAYVANADYELERIRTAFNTNGIDFIPLKGAVIRKFYPQRWMRTSGDIDLLVKEEDLLRAVDLLVSEYGYKTDGEKGYHDITLYSANGISLELHFSIIGKIENIDRLLSRAWDYAQRLSASNNEFVFTNEFFLFHAVSHMAYHFIRGGCGIRSFIDLYLLEKKLSYDKAVFSEMLNECGLETFYLRCLELNECWFNNREYDDITSVMSKYILNGGVYGSYDNLFTVKQLKYKNKFKYFLSRIFVPYRRLKKKYPVLNGKPYLLPVFEVVRWFGLLFGKKMNKSVSEVKIIVNTDEKKENDIAFLLKELDIDAE